MTSQGEAPPVGAIFDTNSRGRFDLVVYSDGILAVQGSYLGVAMRAAGAGVGGAGGGASAGIGAGLGSRQGQGYESKRLGRLLQQTRAELLEANRKNHFIARASITHIVLRKRWHGCAITIESDAAMSGRTYSWKPALNDFASVRKMVCDVFGDVVEVDDRKLL